jgi:hypothetical protein
MVFYTLNQVINLISQISLAHKQVNDFGFGEPSSISASEQIAYPLVWMDIQPSSISEKTLSLAVTLYVLDIVRDNEDNETDTLSDCLSIAQDIYAELANPSYEDYFLIQYSAPLTPIREGFPDKVNGWQIDLILDLQQVRDRCQVPSFPIPNPEVECRPAILTLNGNTFLTVPSGDVENIVLQDTNSNPVTPVSVVGSVITVPNTGGGGDVVLERTDDTVVDTVTAPANFELEDLIIEVVDENDNPIFSTNQLVYTEDTIDITALAECNNLINLSNLTVSNTQPVGQPNGSYWFQPL